MSVTRRIEIVETSAGVHVLDETGRPIGAADYAAIFELLKRAQQDDRARVATEAARALTWHSVDSWRDYQHITECVYLMYPTYSASIRNLPPPLAAAWPRVLKVGFTRQPLNARRKRLSIEYGSLTVLAYALTDDVIAAERGLHELLKDHHINGEWFNLDAAWDFLCQNFEWVKP